SPSLRQHRVPVYPAPKSMPRAPTVAPTAISGTGPTRHITMAPTVASASTPGTSPATAVGSTFSKATVIIPMMAGLVPWRAGVDPANRWECLKKGKKTNHKHDRRKKDPPPRHDGAPEAADVIADEGREHGNWPWCQAPEGQPVQEGLRGQPL